MGTNARTLSPYETIDANVGSWRGNKDQVMISREFSCESYYSSYLLQPTIKGFWAAGGTYDGFLGVRLISGGHSYFGWARMSNLWDWVTIKDYAFNSKPGQAILAGQSQTGPIGYWPFDGNGSDQSGNNRDLALVGSSVFGTGIFGRALSL